MARLPNFLVIIRSEKLSGKGQGRGGRGAKKRTFRFGKKNVSFPKVETFRFADYTVIPETPFDVLAWFKKAEYIVTDTFHGTIFSIITHRPFCSLVRDSNEQKLGSLLEQLALGERKILKGDFQKIGSVLNIPVDYDKVDNVLQEERRRVMEYMYKQLVDIGTKICKN